MPVNIDCQPPNAVSGYMIMYQKIVAAVIVLLMTTGCASQLSLSYDRPLQLQGLQTKTLKDVTVSVAILTDDAAQEHFGFDFGAAGLSAVWLSIRNESALKLWFMRNALDPDIFSPDEVTLMLDGHYSAEQQEAIRQFLRNKSVRVLMEPGMITEGFVYLPKVLGGRYIDIRLAPDAFAVEMARRRGDTQSLPHEYLDLRFGFSVPLPDGSTLLSFTVIQTPNLTDDAFACQCTEIEHEFDNIRRAVE